MHNASTWSRALLFLSLLFGLVLSPIVRSDTGPGLPNLTYTSSEVFKTLSTFHSTDPSAGNAARGEGTVAMHDGFLFVPWGVDSGLRGGGVSFYNISNPRSPVRISNVSNTSQREPHGYAFSNSYPGHYAVMQAIDGIIFWDFTNHTNPTVLKHLVLPGIEESDYNLGAWWAFWQAPYVYVGGSGNGLLIVDATDPKNPVYKKTIPTSTWGGFRVGPTFAVGNLLVMTSMDQSGLVTMDISDPLNPKLLAKTSTTPGQYSGIVNGNRILTAGTDNIFRVYDISDPTKFTQTAASPNVGDKGGYVSVQDGFGHSGFSAKYAKINLSTGAIAGTGSSGISGRDEDFGNVLGNLVFVSSDHTVGSVLMPHQTGPDTTGPSVNMVSPKNNSTNQATTSRVGITLTDSIDLNTVTTSTFIVRVKGTTSALPGKYSNQQAIVNFWPTTPFATGTIYEVVVPAGGIKDWAGNTVPTTFTSTFTTAGSAPDPECTLATRSAATLNSSVTFNPGSVIGSGLKYTWIFGDGASSTQSTSSTATHTYTALGHYTVILIVEDSRGITSSCSANQTVYSPPTSTAPKSSATIAYDSSLNRVWVVNSDANTVTAVDASSNAKVLEKPVGLNPQTIARAPDGRIWVANMDSSSISVLDPSTGNLAQTIALPRGSQPFGLVFSPNGSAAYVSLQGTGNLLKLNVTTGATLGTVSVGPSPRGIAVSGDSSRILVTRFISPSTRGEVKEVSASAFTVTRTFALAIDTNLPDTEESGRGVPNYISSVAIQPDGKRAWIPSKKDNILRGTFRDGQPLTFESTTRTIVSQIDLGSNAEVFSDRLDLNDRAMANNVIFSPIGDLAFISTQGTNDIQVIDVYSRQINTGIVDVGLAPRGMVITPNGKLFVQNFMSRTVAIYDVSTLLNATDNAATQLAVVNSVASELLSPTVLKGKQIFYNAADRRMSLDKYISCAGCHQDAGQDGQVFDFTDRGEGFRNTSSLKGRRGTGQGRVHWTANFDEIQDFENDIRNNFGGTGFMTDAQFNTGTRSQPLGDPKAGVSADLDALAAYVTSLSTVGPSPFRNPDGTLTANAVLGQALFQGKGQCATCHSGADFTDSASGVLHDVGTIKASSGKRLGQTLTGLDTPTLKGVWETAPYLHDGSAATLLDVLTTQNTAGKHGAALTATEQAQVVEYLKQIDDAGVTPPASPITNLSAKDTTNAADWSVAANLQVGNAQYGDRTFTLTSVPSILLGAGWIRTANDSKNFTGNPTVTFTLTRTADVYVGVDTRVPALSWMTGWTNTGLTLVNSESTARTFTLFKKNFVAGTVSLGPSTSAGSMYTVVVK